MTGSPADRPAPARPAALPPELAERVVARNDHELRPRGYVLLWMRTAVRGHDNPALDVALTVANAGGLPLLVYHAVAERYPYASDRHHTFILEGARDVATELAARGIPYVLHVEREGHRGPHLRTLAAAAALVVTEEFPVAPLRAWTDALASSIDTPVWTVDTACVVPMRLSSRAPERAYQFRSQFADDHAARLRTPWVDVMPGPATVAAAARLAAGEPVFELPFTPVDPRTHDLAELVAQCAIDHGVGPVPHTRGGSTAGYARWEAFRAARLGTYARDRNDPLRGGVSRLSAYLHYGHVSPLRIAREAVAAGADKFVDELFVWRELAYHACFHRPALDRFEALPGWARKTLREHASDPRPNVWDWETLARGRTGDALWDAAQTSLRIHGELHNNVRMTWGKAFFALTRGPEQAIERMIDLNHRYALDGRDPCSYAGLLWCGGLFDRPFSPEQPVLGSVRPRPTSEHARRLDVVRYERATRRPAVRPSPRVAVVGAGVGGLACARTLHDHGLEVEVFDKGRGPGGRMSTRRVGELTFDHGAQYFTARDPRFERYVLAWEEAGVVAQWRGRVGEWSAARPGSIVARPAPSPRWVGAPRMSAVPVHLARELAVRSGVRVGEVRRDGSAWRLLADDGRDLGSFDVVLLNTPPAQAAPLLAAAPELQALAVAHTEGERAVAPCWAGMFAFGPALAADWDAVAVEGHPVVAWAARDASKPGRDAAADAWVVHASPVWTRAHLHDEPEAVSEALRAGLAEVLGLDPAALARATTYAAAHRWGYARAAIPSGPLSEHARFDAALRVGVCGDWLAGPKVESAFLSGIALAGRVLGTAAQAPPQGQASFDFAAA